ncbi:MAG TPA: OB-fold nucleic acid binding domain-containing protein [Thermoflexales bacterium]|nr:OB-fold nucleic acid binding domain-containing protein [Thermoflexales bacterium]
MRLVRALVVILAVAGVAALVMASRAQARPITVISAITPSMNFAYVRLEGVVPAYPSLSPQNDYLSFRVRDDTGEMRVFAYRAAAQALANAGAIPMPGHKIAVEGTLRVRDDEPTLTLNTAEALLVEPMPALKIELAGLQALNVGERAITSGQARKIKDAGGLKIISLRKGNAQADATLQSAAPLSIKPGDWISVTAGVTEYRDAKQLALSRAEDIAITLPALADEVRPVAALSKDLLGQWVTVRGVVSDLRPSKTVTRITLDDGAEIDATLFEVWQQLPFSQTLKVGDTLLVSGLLTEYRSQLEIQPELSVDVRIEK